MPRTRIRKQTIEHLLSSTQNRTYHEAIQWLAAQLRTAAQEVPVLNNTLLNVEPLDVLGVMDAIEAHYQNLDGFGSWCISKSINCLEIQDKRTLRMFKDLLIRAAIDLKRQGVVVDDTDIKAIYLNSAFLVYGVDGLQGMALDWPNHSELSFVNCSDHYEFLLQSHRHDEDLSKMFQETSSTKKQKSSHSVKGLVKMADNVITFTNDKSKATEHSVNFSTEMCDHPDCNKLKTATHTSSKC
jgi:hypothetical protein